MYELYVCREVRDATGLALLTCVFSKSYPSVSEGLEALKKVDVGVLTTVGGGKVVAIKRGGKVEVLEEVAQSWKEILSGAQKS